MLGDDLVLATDRSGVIQLRVFAENALLFGVLKVVPNIGRVEQAFGRNTAYQQAGTAEPRLLFNQCRFEAVLAGAHRR